MITIVAFEMWRLAESFVHLKNAYRNRTQDLCFNSFFLMSCECECCGRYFCL